MELIFIFLGSFITIITCKKVIEENILDKIYIKKFAKVIGFENSYYLGKNKNLDEELLYLILEVEEKNKIINLVLPIYDKKYIKEGEQIEIVYPKEKIESCKIYNYRSNFKLNYLLMMCGILVIISSIIGF